MITDTGDSLERERKSVATASSDNDRKARAVSERTKRSGVSEGCGDWSVHGNNAKHMGFLNETERLSSISLSHHNE